MAQQEQAHVCGTERQRQTDEGEEDPQETHGHSLPAHGGAAAVIGRGGGGDRSESGLNDALRTNTVGTDGHSMSAGKKDFSIFKERKKIYCSSMYILFSALSYQNVGTVAKTNDFCAKM